MAPSAATALVFEMLSWDLFANALCSCFHQSYFKETTLTKHDSYLAFIVSDRHRVSDII